MRQACRHRCRYGCKRRDRRAADGLPQGVISLGDTAKTHERIHASMRGRGMAHQELGKLHIALVHGFSPGRGLRQAAPAHHLPCHGLLVLARHLAGRSVHESASRCINQNHSPPEPCLMQARFMRACHTRRRCCCCRCLCYCYFAYGGCALLLGEKAAGKARPHG